MKLDIEKFDGTHYLLWKNQAKGFLIENGVWKGVDDETATEDEKSRALFALTCIVEKSILVKFTRHTTTAADLWEALQSRYASASPEALHALSKKLNQVILGDDMEAYIDEKSTIIADLVALGSVISEPEQCLALLDGLNNETFGSFIQTVHARGVKNYTFDELCTNLRNLPKSTPAVAMVAKKTYPSPPAPGPCKVCKKLHWLSDCPDVICACCKKKGHIAKYCSANMNTPRLPYLADLKNEIVFSWSVDSGASFPMTNNLTLLENAKSTRGVCR